MRWGGYSLLIQHELTAKFQGGLAEQHRLPAYEASKSLYGVSRSLLITLNYLSEGRVRRRDFSPQAFHLNFVTHRPGSFETLYEIVANTDLMAITASLGAGVAGNFLTDFIRSIFKRCVGQEAEASIEELETKGSLNAGDTGALVDAIEPAMREAHTAINHGAGQIIVISGSNNIVSLNDKTKKYVWSSIADDGIKTKLFSVAVYNANQRTGRVFDFELGKTIPYEISKDADRESISAILSSISSYAFRKLGDDLRSSVALKYRSISSVDGRTKRIIILKARKELKDL